MPNPDQPYEPDPETTRRLREIFKDVPRREPAFPAYPPEREREPA